MRNEYIAGVNVIPEDLTRFLARIGGKNPWGENMYRLVYAESRFIKIAGEFTEWDPSVPIEERRGFRKVKVKLKHPKRIYADVDGTQQVVGEQEFEEKLVPTARRPLRTWTGIKETPRYSNQKGIILERWHPEHQYGSRATWEQIQIKDGTPILGPFPEHGDYEAVVGPWTEMPAVSALLQAVEYVEDNIQNNRYSPLARIAQRTNQALREAEKQSEEFQREIVTRLKQKTAALMSDTLEAGRERNRMAQKAGLRHHIGN